MAPRLSLILPVFDRRDCDFAALKAALTQDAPRESYEVVAVLGREGPLPGDIEALLSRCDRVVQTDLDPDLIENEIDFYHEGVDHSTGRSLFFLEGHTVARPDAVRHILRFLEDHPECQLLWGPREDFSKGTLGQIIGNYATRRMLKFHGNFGFGGTSIIGKELFERLGGV